MRNSALESIMCCKIFSSTLRWGVSEHCLVANRKEGSKHAHSSQVVRVGHKQVLLALGEELIQNTGVQESVVQVTVTGRVPVLLVIVCALRAGKKSLLVDSRVTRLIEGGDAQLLIGILLDDPEGIFVSIEGCHQDKRDIDVVGGIEMFDLTNSQVEEGHVVLDFEGTLRPCHSHRGSQPAIDLENGQLVEVLDVRSRWNIGVRNDLILSGRLDTVPIAEIDALS
jgi:hypothetical protein